jgi:hypothetical protein
VSELTQRDSDLVNDFLYALIQKAGSYGIPVRTAGFNEQRDDDYLLWLVVYRFQLGVSMFELYINTKMPEDTGCRYGWNRTGMF